MAPVTRKNDNDAPAADGERQAELEAQLAQLRAEIVALQAKNLTPRPPPPESKPRVPSGLPKFKGKRDEDVRQWLFQVETLCRINGHDATDSTARCQRSLVPRWRPRIGIVPVLGLSNASGGADVGTVYP
ncbi:hypothetical protein PF006_g17511 [Phytophthora fragariae]|uniref:Uncharacterized protein n=1 Tax=Phytophthora fragariae TaxID=53985 RepID=A0A6A3SU74_9STRA|nr:hypothetical protein PF003_g3430 [Phytophthora fragariae]KAE9123028.1 hypothetical protein PF006_g17511 [Phytophthora fragariae]